MVKTAQQYSWTGNILTGKEEGLLGEITLSYNNGIVSGSITYKEEAYQIQPLDEASKIYAMYKLDKAYKVGPLCGSNQEVVQNDTVSDGDKGVRRDTCTGGNIRVFFFFTNEAQNSSLNVNATINKLFDI
jgi:hypothetical protein